MSSDKKSTFKLNVFKFYAPTYCIRTKYTVLLDLTSILLRNKHIVGFWMDIKSAQYFRAFTQTFGTVSFKPELNFAV